jgi:hypothetical protein
MKHSSLRVWAISVMTLSATLCIAAANSKADDFVDVGGTEYDVTTSPLETFASASSVLEAQPWWGNPTLADELASAVYLALGDPNGNGQTPTFAYGTGPDAYMGVPYTAVDNYDYNECYGGGSCTLTDWTSTNDETISSTYQFYFATATVVPTPETSTIGLLLVGLGSLGVMMAMRKRKAQGLAQAA